MTNLAWVIEDSFGSCHLEIESSKAPSSLLSRVPRDPAPVPGELNSTQKTIIKTSGRYYNEAKKNVKKVFLKRV